MIQYLPDRDLPELFERVQRSHVFADGKTFVDACPKVPPAEVLASYEQARSRVGFDLHSFVLAHFDLPDNETHGATERAPNMRSHLHQQWQYLVRDSCESTPYSTLIPLPHPYVVPGGRFREMFYWDSFFTIVGLLESGEDTLVDGMLQNFAYLIDRFGYIPNGNRCYFLGRSQPPYFAAMLHYVAKRRGISAVLHFYPALCREYRFWMDHNRSKAQRCIRLTSGELTNRYFGGSDMPRAEAWAKEIERTRALCQTQRGRAHRHLRAACESGWDFSSRWYAANASTQARTMDLAPIDLNSLLYFTEIELARLAKALGKSSDYREFTEHAERRRNLMRTHFFSNELKAFCDFDIERNEANPVLTAACVLPLFAGIATDEQATATADTIRQKLLKAGGLVTSEVTSGEQWDAPNGWAPLQFLAVEGLLQYGHKKLALEIAGRWLHLNEEVFSREGRLMEKYNVIDINRPAGGGDYPNQDGFGWTNGVDLVFYRLLDEYSVS